MEENVENEFILSPGVKNNTAEVIAEVKHVSKRYKGCLALNDVSVQIHRGDLIGLVGKNGAGKTTLIRVLTGLAKPSSGSFSLFSSSPLIKGIRLSIISGHVSKVFPAPEIA